ncbi:hypothetical protein K461DRAFT_43032 [Myriangium duriaei CBS 260.36]|uniref:Uncharacterized protein n=1 Tax=Myriangium duriaei CBS 260.36 TaxID=1168546 RepID=A0A9P4IWY5_9PEZI|nr:hypothetical protein K461DRAFT_43032 [Myriangium duriaei CBS 260.36]
MKVAILQPGLAVPPFVLSPCDTRKFHCRQKVQASCHKIRVEYRPQSHKSPITPGPNHSLSTLHESLIVAEFSTFSPMVPQLLPWPLTMNLTVSITHIVPLHRCMSVVVVPPKSKVPAANVSHGMLVRIFSLPLSDSEYDAGHCANSPYGPKCDSGNSSPAQPGARC